MENLNLDELIEEVGGHFILVTLMQKRLRELQQGMPPLIDDPRGMLPYEVVAEEIRQKKIWLVTGEEADKLRAQRKSISAPQIHESSKAGQKTS